MPNEGDVDNVYQLVNGRAATSEEKAVYTGKSWSAPDGLFYGKIAVDYTNLEKAAQSGSAGGGSINKASVLDYINKKLS